MATLRLGSVATWLGPALLMVGAGHADADISASSVSAVLGFEAPENWVVTEGNGSTVSSPNGKTGAAVQLNGSGWRKVQSDTIALPQISSNAVRIDVKTVGIPSSWETLNLVVKLPSRGIWWADLGTVSLSSTANSYATLTFVIPEAVRALLAQASTAPEDFQIFLSVNTPNVVVLDNLRFGDDVPLPGPVGSAGSGKAVVVRGAASQFCAQHRLSVQSMTSDFSDIWSGREAAATGKQAEPNAPVVLDFDAPVVLSTIKAYYQPAVGCADTQAIRLRPPVGAGLWRFSEAAVGQMTIPQSFNAFVQSDITGLHDSQGPVIAGRSISAGGMPRSFARNITKRWK